MPTYLLHGFRWHRAAIRIHIILQDLEDAAPEWIVAPATSNTLLNSFYTLYDFLPPSNPPAPSSTSAFPPPPPIPDDPPEPNSSRTLTKKNTRSTVSLKSLGRKQRPQNLDTAAGHKPVQTGRNQSVSTVESAGNRHRVMPSTSSARYSDGKMGKPASFNDWSVVKLVEQYDPEDLFSVSQPYAYVADYMVEVTLGVSVAEQMEKYDAKVKADEGHLSGSVIPSTPPTGNTPDAHSPSMSARDVRRKSRRLGWFEKLRDGLQMGEDIGWYVVVCGDEERAAPSLELSQGRPSTSTGSDLTPQRTPKSAGLKNFFSRRKTHADE